MDEQPPRSEKKMIPVAEIVGRALVELGVSKVFGVVGSGNYLTTASLLESGATYTGARHEAGAFSMADAHARVSGQVAVCSVHQGPGLTNLMTGLADAAKYRSPVLVITGQASTVASSTNFTIDQTRLVRATGALSETIRSAETAVEDTVRAFRLAVQERMPVVLNIPLDLQGLLVPADVTIEPPRFGPMPAGDTESIDELVSLVKNATRPLFVAGHGMPFSPYNRALLQSLAQKTDGRLATSALANGFFDAPQRSLGILGGFSSDDTAHIVAQADLVIGFGVAFTSWTTRHEGAFGPHTTVVQIDAFPSVNNLSKRVDRVIVGDAARTAQLLDEALHQQREPGSAQWPPMTSAESTVKHSEQSSLLHPEVLTRALNDLLPSERTLVVDGGHFIGWPVAFLSVPDPTGFVFSSAGFQSIGLGLGAAIGAHIAQPQRQTVLATGDGGFLMAIAELETLARLNIPVLVIVYNDAAYGAEVHHFGADHAGRPLVTFPDTDFAKIARGYGAHGITVNTLDDLAAVSTWLSKPEGPLIVDCKIDPAVVGYWAAQDFQGH